MHVFRILSVCTYITHDIQIKYNKNTQVITEQDIYSFNKTNQKIRSKK